MRYYKVIFSDYSETVGKQENKQKMLADARLYCKMWNLSETVRDVLEISEKEYQEKTKGAAV